MNVKTDLKTEKARQLSLPSKHVFRLLLPVPLLVSMGFIGNLQGWIGSENYRESPPTGLTVPEARVKDLPKDRKYDPGYGGALASVNGIGITLDENSNINSRMISGEKSNATGIGANATATVDALAGEMGIQSNKGVGMTSGPMEVSAQQRKIQDWNRASSQQRILGQRVSTSVDRMYQNPTLTPTEKAGQLRMEQEEEQRLRANEKLLELLERQVQQQNQSPPPTGQDQRDRGTPHHPGTVPSSVGTARDVSPYVRQVIASPNQEPGNAFYGLNGSKIRSGRPEKGRGAIRAVVHGDAQGITVTNGSPVALRLQEETRIVTEGTPLTLPANTLVHGEVNIQGDRIHITVNTIRLDKDLIPVRLEAYDLDGRKGLSVPDLALKQQAASALVQGSTQLASPGYIVGGTVGQQVGGQLASQGLGVALNAGKNLLRRKAQQPLARIRSNHQLLLRSASRANHAPGKPYKTPSNHD